MHMDVPTYNIRNLAQLAKFALIADEEEHFDADVQKIFGAVEKLHNLSVQNIPPTHIVTSIQNRTQGDHVHPFLNHDGLLAAMPAADAGFLRVPSFFKGKRGKLPL